MAETKVGKKDDTNKTRYLRLGYTENPRTKKSKIKQAAKTETKSHDHCCGEKGEGCCCGEE